MSEISLRAYASQNSLRKLTGVQAAPSVEEEQEYQAFAFGRVGRKPGMMFDLIRADGYHLGISYIDVKELESSDPNRGFTIYTPKRKITIAGTNLAKCYGYLLEHRIAELRAADRPTAMGAAETDEVIHEMLIK